MIKPKSDEELAKEFCDLIGCTEVHHLRESLPAFVAKVRLQEQARCIDSVTAEGNIDGDPPQDVVNKFNAMTKVEIARMVVKVFKNQIIKRISGEKTAAPETVAPTNSKLLN